MQRTFLYPSAAACSSPIVGRVHTTNLSRRTAGILPSAMITGGEVPHQEQDSGAAATLQYYPTPLSPPHPPLSRSVELQRAMSAASRSALYSLADDDVVFEDDWLVIVNKPAGVYCETLLSSYSGKKSRSSPPESSQLEELHLANRLDRDTSGLMIITKSHKAAAKLVKAFTEHRVKKTYIALCTRESPEWRRIRITSGHGRSRYGAWRVYAAADVGRTLPGGSLVKKMTTAFELMAVNGKPAAGSGGGDETDVTAEQVNSAAEVEDAEEILVRALPETGRTHQIRLHCQYLGMPIMGDVKYGGVLEWDGNARDFHHLHAGSLAFEHPVTGLPLVFQCPLPPWANTSLS